MSSSRVGTCESKSLARLDDAGGEKQGGGREVSKPHRVVTQGSSKHVFNFFTLDVIIIHVDRPHNKINSSNSLCSNVDLCVVVMPIRSMRMRVTMMWLR